MTNDLFDVAIVGGGPAGLSAALLLARSRRRVMVFDHGRPRNYAAQAVHGYLGLDGIAPAELRTRGRDECAGYGVQFCDLEVVRACRAESGNGTAFELQLMDGTTVGAKKLLLATGVKDDLPEIANIESFYGVSVHHCPYCDGWEHRDQRLVAFGDGESVVDLAAMLLNWSVTVTACTNGQPLSDENASRLRKLGLEFRQDAVEELIGSNGILEELTFTSGEPLACDALFFSASQGQRSNLPNMLGCDCSDSGILKSKGKQGSGIPGLFIAGDADGDTQFAIVAAAEGAIAATAIHQELQADEESSF